MIMSKFNWTVEEMNTLPLPTYITLQKEMGKEAKKAKANSPKMPRRRR